MPNTFIDNRDAWLRMSDIDYLGQFVKVWLAFNAWYRSAYTETQDRKIINEIKWQGNPILSRLRPMFDAASDEAEQFRAEVGLLHHRLEGYELFAGKGATKVRISFCNVFLRERPPAIETTSYRGYEFKIERLANKQVNTEVKRTNGAVVIFHMSQQTHDLVAIEAHQHFTQNLTANQQGLVRQLYNQIAPNWVENLTMFADTAPGTAEIRCGAFNFRCGKDALFAGVMEVLYQMRCILFHGELAPSKDAVACYEPAYRLVRRFLDCVT